MRIVLSSNAPRRLAGQQVPAGLLQRREVRHAVEPEHFAQFRMIGQMRDDAPIVGLQEVLQHQTGEQLMLRELLRTVGMRVEWQHALSRDERRPRHRLRRFTGACHIGITHTDRASRLSQQRSFLLSLRVPFISLYFFAFFALIKAKCCWEIALMDIRIDRRPGAAWPVVQPTPKSSARSLS